jgi:hypothetical protein
LFIALALHQGVNVVSVLNPPVMADTLSLSPVFEVIASVGWTVVFAVAASRLWRSFATTRWVRVLLTIFSLFQILRLAAFAQADYDRQRLPFLVILWLAWVIFWCAIELTRSIRIRRWSTV